MVAAGSKASSKGPKLTNKRTLHYNCEKCKMMTTSSRDYLYHHVTEHQAEMQIFSCVESACDYCTRYKHKILRHYKDIHQKIVPLDTIEAEFSNIKNPGAKSPVKAPVMVPIVKKKAKKKKPLMSKNMMGKKLMVKFKRQKDKIKSILPVATAAAAVVGKSSPFKRAIAQTSGHLSRLVEEVKGENGLMIFKCKECQFTDPDIHTVSKHSVSWHVDTKFLACSKCEYITFDKSDLVAHSNIHRKEHQYKCKECIYSTDFRPNYERHQRYHKVSLPHKCSTCTFSCGSETSLKRHVINHHEPVEPVTKKLKLQAPKPVHAETVTRKSNKTAENVQDAAEVPSDPDNEEEEMDDDFEDISKLKVDPTLFFDGSSASMVPRMALPPPVFENPSLIARETSPMRKLPPNITEYVEKFNGKLVCPVCKLKYKRSSDLNRHMKSKHGCKLREYLENISDEGEFLAQLEISNAGMDTSQNTTLEDDDDDDDDILIKLEAPPAEEDGVKVPEDLTCEYCDYKAKWGSDYKRHLQSHSLERRYKCNDCPKQYKYRGDLNVHTRKDHNKEPGDVKIIRISTMLRKKSSPSIFKCPCCSYTSAYKSEIDRHSRLHNAEKTFQCLHCEYQTYWRGDIRRHVYKRHSEIMTEGVAMNDVIIIKKEFAPQVMGGRKRDNDNNMDSSVTSDSDAMSSRETTPVKVLAPRSHEGSPEVNMSDYVTKTTGRHSPTPSPIKELGNGIYKCQYCGFMANAPSKMNSHIATHTNLKRYMCPVCGRRANWKWDIAKHIRKDHNDQVTQVIKLSKKEAEETIHAYFEEHPTLKRDHHLNLRTEGQETDSNSKDQFYKCSMCDFSAEKRISVNRHVRSMHKGQGASILLVRKPKVVQIASVPSATSSHPPSPAKVHPVAEIAVQQEGAKPFMCSECGKRGATKGDVKKHYHYAHAEKEIRIVYLGDGSQSVYAAKGELIQEKLHMTPEKVSPMAVSPGLMASPGSGSDQNGSPKSQPASKHPKVMGYIKPFMCGYCGRRSNWRWDINRHVRERHPSYKDINVLELSEEEARATYDEYMKNQLPGLNKVSNSVPKRRHKVLVPTLVTKPTGTVPNNLMPLQPTPGGSNYLVPIQTAAQVDTSQPVFPQAFVLGQTSSAVMIPNIPAIGAETPTVHLTQRASNFKQYKCSACSYRSNYRSDIQRHMVRRHGPSRAKVVVLDKEIARATLPSYKYNKNEVEKDFVEQKQGQLVLSPSGPLPPKAWEGLEKKIWKCSMCSYFNEDKVDVLKHLGKHNMKNYKCSDCNWTSNFRSAVSRHIQTKHANDSTVQCRLCIKLIKEGPGLDQTGHSIMPKGIEAAPRGEAVALGSGEALVAVTGQESMRNPQSVVTTAVYHCKVCNFSSSWRSCICRHLNKMHSIKDYCANIVKKIVRTSKSAYDQNSTTCITSQVTTSPGTPKKVDHVSSRPKNFACKICPYRTYKRKMLKFHLTCHKPQPGVKQVKCKYCPYYVSSNRLLSQHLHLHMQDFKTVQENSYPLTPEKSSPQVTTPSKSPLQPKRHRCQKCPYTTNSKNDFLYHKQFHRPKPTADYKCDYCEYWVSHRRLIKQHMKVHKESAEYDSEAVTPSKLDYSENALVYDTVEIAAIKQRIIASKITPNISNSPLVSPMKIASSCSVGGRRGFLRKDGTYRKVHQCRHCPYMNIRLRNMKLHEMMHGKRTTAHPLMKCIHCDYHVGSKGLLAHHMKVHQKDYGIEFFEHGQKIERSDSMASEESEADSSITLEKKVDTLLEITRFKKFGCEKCPYATSKRGRFQHHVELHGSKQKCKCDFCDYSVPTMNLLNQHARLHFEPNQNLLAAQSILNLQYLPEMPADVALASMIANNNAKNPVSITHDHVELYENQAEDMEPKKLYRCDRCPYANVRRDNLLAHLRCHMIKNEFVCPYCDYSVGKTHVLVQHVKVHFSPLPELSEWLVENGNTERLKETKHKDMEEAIEVVKRFQIEKKAAKEQQKADKAVKDAEELKEKENGADEKKEKPVEGGKTGIEDKTDEDKKACGDSADVKASTSKTEVADSETNADGKPTKEGNEIIQVWERGLGLESLIEIIHFFFIH